MNARDIARVLGRRGGRSRARRLSAVARKRIASLGGRARARSLRAARRIEENFRYAAAAATLSSPARPLDSHVQPDGRLPGIYPAAE